MIRVASMDDVERLLDLASERRLRYALYHPLFHRPAQQARELQRPFFERLLADPDFIALVSEEVGHVDGFLIGHAVTPPPVYDPGGLTYVVDDFVVEDPRKWPAAGRDLLEGIGERAKAMGAVQVIVVTAPQDVAKTSVVKEGGFETVAEWAVRAL